MSDNLDKIKDQFAEKIAQQLIEDVSVQFSDSVWIDADKVALHLDEMFEEVMQEEKMRDIIKDKMRAAILHVDEMELSKAFQVEIKQSWIKRILGIGK